MLGSSTGTALHSFVRVKPCVSVSALALNTSWNIPFKAALRKPSLSGVDVGVCGGGICCLHGDAQQQL